MTAPALKRLAVAIWTSESFNGSRNDAERLARDQLQTAPDLFHQSEFAPQEQEVSPAEDHPDQLHLF